MKCAVRRLLQASLALVLTANVAERAAASIGATTEVARIDAEGMTITGDALTWTTNTPGGFGLRFYAEVWTKPKASDLSTVSQRLYGEDRATSVAFGSVVPVTIANTQYVYFVANYDDAITYIKRIPLTGGQASIVSRVSFMGLRDLKTDGTYLYWADVDGVRRMPIEGGTITTLHRTSRTTQVSLDADYVYFNVFNAVHRVLKTGGAVTQLATGWDTITDLQVHKVGTQTTLFWGESHAAVVSQPVGSNIPTFHQLSMEGRSTTSVAFDGSRLFWIDCASGTGDCQTRTRDGDNTLRLNIFHQERAHNLLTEPNQLFWNDSEHIFRYQHPLPLQVVFNPAIIRAQREGGGGVSRDAHVLVTGGDPPFLYDWRSENPVFLIDYLPQGPRAGLYAPVAACDTQETVLKVTVIDRAGRRASALADVAFKATRTPGGVCD